MDAAQDRLVDDHRAGFADAVEATRTGWIFAHDAKQYGRWRSSIAAALGRRQDGRPLRQLIRDMGGGASGVEVVTGEFEFRKDEPIQ